VFSSHATAMSLVLFAPGTAEPLIEFPLDPRYNRTGDVWHAFISDLDPGFDYGYRAHRTAPDESPIHRFDNTKILVDPYAHVLAGAREWHGDPREPLIRARRSRVVDDEFDWGHDVPLDIHLADSIVYELHVRGFTRHPSSKVSRPGTFEGVTEKIPYLKELGVTAVELMPVTDFEEDDNSRINPITGQRLKNYWGYHPISFFALKQSYSGGDALHEFKSMVKQLHRAGIEVILDMVLNHTAEGDERGPTMSFRGLDNSTYYLLDPETGRYLNYSGCGNTMNCNHPVLRDLILHALRYWVTEVHIDGFRFDLASILGRGRNGEVLANPPLLERIAADPVLARTKLIAEAWDAAGLYQVGTFPNWGRWAEWNGRFRDDIRRFVRGDRGMVAALATRIAGSSDLYEPGGRAPFHSINFVTSHDGFTLADLVSYNRKHNITNGERNRDGTNANWSWNCGEEGPSASPEINTLRTKQMKNLVTLLFFSQGVPMMLAGDEVGRTQYGNNNAYCHDDETNWFDWRLVEQNAEFLRYVKLLIAFRKRHVLLRRRTFFDNNPSGGAEVSWHGVHAFRPDWSEKSRTLGMLLNGGEAGPDIYLLAHSGSAGIQVELATASHRRKWFRLIDTSLRSPDDIADEGREQLLSHQDQYPMAPRSVIVLTSG